ncbi:MAG: diguanylate cyclase [Candidatus Omnitrophica bacterium]|jgi:diguanylate cyclase (GGDEF)-like protein|nr:diguanylate cyclase [Candidatus Omnitrophota bacterium]
MKKVKRILIISSDKHLRDILHFCFDGWGYEVFIHELKIDNINAIKKISPDAIVIDVHSATKSHLEICRLLKEDFITALIPIITLINKGQLREQLLTLKQGVDDYLIKPPDPLDLRTRIEIAIKRSQYSFYSSPLTGLPGARLIEDIVKERIEKDIPFSFAHIDIDNFKSFNDVYGYIKGDKALMQTAYILYSVIKKFGNAEDFMGHIGGDDFVFITTPDKHKEICRYFIFMFDNLMPYHYSRKDKEQNFIIAHNRSKQIRKMPLMSVTIAVVNKNKPKEFKNIVEVNERVAEVKRYLKTVPGSKFMADRRTSAKDKEDLLVYKKEDFFATSYKPIGQILIEQRKITEVQLEEALALHWKRGIILGEILRECGFVTAEDIEKALNIQKQILEKSRK